MTEKLFGYQMTCDFYFKTFCPLNINFMRPLDVLTSVRRSGSQSDCASSRLRLFSLVWLRNSFFLFDSILLHLSFSSSFVLMLQSGKCAEEF